MGLLWGCHEIVTELNCTVGVDMYDTFMSR